MKLILAFIVGAVWGVLCAYVNMLILRRALQSGRGGKMMGAHVLRGLIDLALLAVIVLLRNVLPFPFEMVLAGAVSAMGMMGIYFAFRTAGDGVKQSEKEKETTADSE